MGLLSCLFTPISVFYTIRNIKMYFYKLISPTHFIEERLNMPKLLRVHVRGGGGGGGWRELNDWKTCVL